MKNVKISRLHSVIMAIRRILRGIKKIFTPDPAGWRSAAIGIIIITFTLLLILPVSGK